MRPAWTRPTAWLGTITTRRTLRLLRGALLVSTVAALVGSLAVFLGVQRNARAVAERTAPAILDVHGAQVALLDAHGAAVRSFDRDEMLLGAGEGYRDQIAVAEQTLTRVAENNAAGDRGSQEIQVISALLNGYRRLIEEASVYVQQSGTTDNSALVYARVQDASSVLRQMLLRLDRLRGYQTEMLDRQVDAGWTAPAAFLVWLVPVLVLLTLLVATQVFLSRRFRRTLNLPLVVATALTVLLAGGAAMSLVATARLDGTREAVRQVGAEWQARVRQAQDANDRNLAGLLGGRDTPAAAAPDATPAAATDATVVRSAQAVERAETAADGHRIEFGLPIASLLSTALILYGLQVRIEEYKYRRR